MKYREKVNFININVIHDFESNIIRFSPTGCGYEKDIPVTKRAYKIIIFQFNLYFRCTSVTHT